MGKRKVKGLVLISLVAIVVACCLMLVACGQTTTKTDTTDGSTTTDSESAESTVGESGNSGTSETDDTSDSEAESIPQPQTPAEYKALCEEKIVEKVSEYLSSELTRATISNVELVKLNAKDGKVFVTADCKTGIKPFKYFYELDSDLGDISKNTYKEISQKCDSLTFSDFEEKTILEGAISEEKYNDLCNYVLADVGLNGGTVLNATKFYTSKDGMPGTILTVLYNGKIATVGAYCHSATTDNTQCINEMLDPEANNDIRITSYDDFVDFDYLNNEATMS
ncbi:MAG: hypothetical protein ACI4MT_00485 [Christensenellales bacterium]